MIVVSVSHCFVPLSFLNRKLSAPDSDETRSEALRHTRSVIYREDTEVGGLVRKISKPPFPHLSRHWGWRGGEGARTSSAGS